MAMDDEKGATTVTPPVSCTAATSLALAADTDSVGLESAIGTKVRP